MQNSADLNVWESWRDRLLVADVGSAISNAIIEEAKHKAQVPTAELFAAIIAKRLRRLEAMVSLEGRQPGVIMTMGINGSGKTTTIAKLSRYYLAQQKTLLLAAGDTFRAAAREQLEKWAATLGGLEVISGSGDPAAVAYKATAAGVERELDVVLIDTSGRLPTQAHLMAELGKIRRAIDKALPGAPHELLLILDATGGQNSLRQIQGFSAAAGVTGVIVTKLDGSAKGGFLLAMAAQTPLPVRFIGVGEGSDDLALFDADEYAAALMGVEPQARLQ
ncbi:MAG: signal recognition particle-docking protein FtsY [Proteobacteria bacterium]|nr:signal recognition particle-docking protein FtsY [Pseudomonadota bacterium]